MNSCDEKGCAAGVGGAFLQSWTSLSRKKQAFLSVMIVLVMPILFRTASPAVRTWIHHRGVKAPAEISGMWTTDASSYQGRYLSIHDHYFATKFDPGDLPSIQEIKKVEVKQSGHIKDYTLFYTDQSLVNGQITIEVDSRSTNEMHLKNQAQILWTKDVMN